MKEGSDCVKKARRRIRVCLFLVVMIAVFVGTVYYYQEMRNTQQISDGILVKGWQEGSRYV